MAEKVKYPTKTSGKDAKVSEKEREEGGYGMAEKEGVERIPLGSQAMVAYPF